jgi:ferredoxin
MPIIRYKGQLLECKPGATLRDILLKYELTVHNGVARYINCRGFGTCGTCAVSVTGPTSPRTTKEKWRLNFPPHKIENGLRLACQVKVMGDIEVKKFQGFWGEKVD